MATPFPMRIWRCVYGVGRSTFGDHEQEHENPPSRDAAARQASINRAMITARINQPSTINHQSSFQSGLAISLQVDC
jgi:hypothetical protein